MKYKDSSYSTEERIDDLMERMSLDEKTRQLTCSLFVRGNQTAADKELNNGIGAVAMLGGKDSPLDTARFIREQQEYIMSHSPNQIPALFHCEALSGAVITACMQFPTSVGQGAAFNSRLTEKMGAAVKRQLMALGIRQALAPVVDVCRELRWGRVNETYGADPTLVSRMAVSYVKGLQGDDLRYAVAATAKHFIGYSRTEGALNMSRSVITERELRETFGKPFEAVIHKAGIKAVMNAYSEYDGEPVCTSKKLLKGILRGDMMFDGLIVSDYSCISKVVDIFRLSKNVQEAAVRCLISGMDMEFPEMVGYGTLIREAVKIGRIEEKWVDLAVRRILRLKFELGLFENPYPEESFSANANTDQELCQNMTRQAMTLTKNNGILPIRDRKMKIALIGPTGSCLRYLYAGYTYVAIKEMTLGTEAKMAGVVFEETKSRHILGGNHEDLEQINDIIAKQFPKAKTIKQALSEQFDHMEVTEGCHISKNGTLDYEGVMAAISEADIVFLALGGKCGMGLHCTTGEGIDSAEIGLSGQQDELLHLVCGHHNQVVIIHTDSRPITSEYAYEHAAAILETWLPGTYGAEIIAETVTGINNPGGGLPMDVPGCAGCGEIYHYQHNGSGINALNKNFINPAGYIDRNAKPLRPFGYGLSYTEFEYSDFSMHVTKEEIPKFTISIDVHNTGGYDGDTVVQLYGKDMIANMVRPRQELIGFERVSVKKNETRKVIFEFDITIFSYLDENMEWIVERGEFEFWIGRDSESKVSGAAFFLDTTSKIKVNSKCFYAETSIQ